MRVIFIKPNCPLCKECLIAIDIFNKNHPFNPIEIVDVTYPSFDLYLNIAVDAFGNNLITPSIIFDGKRTVGTSGWREVLSYLNTLDKNSRGVN